MDISSQSISAFSNEDEDKEKFIKKNISPVQRGPSAIFGDPLSQSNDLMNLHSPGTSQRNSRVSMDNEQKQKQEPPKEELKEQLREQQEEVEQDKRQEEYERVNNKEEQQVIEEGPIFRESVLSPISIQEEKEKQPSPRNQEPRRQSMILVNSSYGNSAPASLLSNKSNAYEQKPIMQEIYTESKVEKLRLKHNKLHLIQHSTDQSKLILEILQRNTHHLQSIQDRINSQSVILNQFKEETSRKLEENIKLALKEKMNEINRENSKELKDIKNICINLQELFLLYSKRMDSLEKKVQALLGNVKK